MKILTYLQARKEIVVDLSEDQLRRILTISGRAQEWIPKITKLVEEKGEESDIAIVEQSGMGREILNLIPRDEWVYLVNPSLAPVDSLVVSQLIVSDGEIFSSAFWNWLLAQEIGAIFLLSKVKFTNEEASVMRLLWSNQESVIERESLAVALWGDQWSQKYSDWGIDALMSRIRKKISNTYQIVTIKGRGYMFVSTNKPTDAPKAALSRGELVQEITGSIYPSDEYLIYMNDPKRVRKVYKDLFASLKNERLMQGEPVEKILCVNSYSYDNVDSIVAWIQENGWKKAKIYFAHYDPRAVEMHLARINELGVGLFVESHYDDIRDSKMKTDTFDLVINDFRLNFNQNDDQNKATLAHTNRVLKNRGVGLFSTVVDGRYENVRYGLDQEKAPINANKPGMFQADEHLVRRCWSVPYFKQLFAKSGFKKIIEFDIEEGKRWGAGSVSLTVNPWQGPFYRRWMLRK